jgi:glycosyltransferase involved in cell wall biosynthesis
MSPRVSVVVPTYNNAAFVEDTIESILEQTFTDFELVIADHASQDGTWELLQRFADDSRVRLLQTEGGGGAQRNWNRVSLEARGEWIKLVCGDDLLYPSSLEVQLAAADDAATSGDIALVASPRAVVDAHGRRVLSTLGLAGLTGHVPGRAAIRRSVRKGTNIFGEPCATLLRRDTLEQAGWWDGTHGYFIDEATYFKVLLHGDLLAVPETLSAFRVSASQWSVRLANEQAQQAVKVHRDLLSASSGVVTSTDVRVGNVRAYLRALQRRMAYVWLRRRMSPTTRA